VAEKQKDVWDPKVHNKINKLTEHHRPYASIPKKTTGRGHKQKHHPVVSKPLKTPNIV
jgi:hypothetical protein